MVNAKITGFSNQSYQSNQLRIVILTTVIWRACLAAIHFCQNFMNVWFGKFWQRLLLSAYRFIHDVLHVNIYLHLITFITMNSSSKHQNCYTLVFTLRLSKVHLVLVVDYDTQVQDKDMEGWIHQFVAHCKSSVFDIGSGDLVWTYLPTFLFYYQPNPRVCHLVVSKNTVHHGPRCWINETLHFVCVINEQRFITGHLKYLLFQKYFDRFVEFIAWCKTTRIGSTYVGLQTEEGHLWRIIII